MLNLIESYDILSIFPFCTYKSLLLVHSVRFLLFLYGHYIPMIFSVYSRYIPSIKHMKSLSNPHKIALNPIMFLLYSYSIPIKTHEIPWVSISSQLFPILFPLLKPFSNGTLLRRKSHPPQAAAEIRLWRSTFAAHSHHGLAIFIIVLMIEYIICIYYHKDIIFISIVLYHCICICLCICLCICHCIVLYCM